MRAVQDVLQGAGVDATALLCPTAYPADAHAHEQMVRADLAKTRLRIRVRVSMPGFCGRVPRSWTARL